MRDDVFDYVIVGSGFGGSVSALRLAEKGYRVLVLERGRRFRDEDFARSTWDLRRYLWAPALRCFGILQISPFRDVFVLHGAGVGGGSLGYANVLTAPDAETFDTPAWRHLADWGALLAPHYATARRMLGVAENPRLGPADAVLRGVAESLGTASTFRPVPVGTYFGEPGREGEEVPDPYFGGEGPARRGCIHCGACMVGCRHNAKNTLVKNYLWLAERRGVEIRAECEVRDVRPVDGAEDGARYEVEYRSSTRALGGRATVVRARYVVLAAGALGTLRLLFRCRDVTRSLPRLSPRLGDRVRTNSEALLGVMSRGTDVDYSKGVAITSIFNADAVTTVEPVRYPRGSSALRFLAGPLVDSGGVLARAAKTVLDLVRRPVDVLRAYVLPGWAQRTTILLVMQTEDNRIRVRLGRSPFTAFRRDLVSLPDDERTVPTKVEVGHRVAREFAARTNGVAMGSINEGVLGIPMTAHILGGCPVGRDAAEGVVGLDGQVHGYPGLLVVDGSIMPGNPGVNPSLTIAALAEHVMSLVPSKGPPALDAAGSTAPPPRRRDASLRTIAPTIALLVGLLACGPGARDAGSDNGPLYSAIRAGDVARVRALLAEGANPNSREVRGRALARPSPRSSAPVPAPIVVAIREKRAEVVRLLLDAGATVTAADEAGFTPLEHAVDTGDSAIVRAVLTHGGDARQPSKFGFPLLFAAACTDHAEVVDALVGAGAPVDARDAEGRAGRHYVGGLESVYDRLRQRTDGPTRPGATPLLLAAQRGLPAVVRVLLARGAVVDATDAAGRTPLMVAAESGISAGSTDRFAEVTRLLLARGARPDARDAHGETAVDRARVLAGIGTSSDTVLRLLTAAGAR